MFIDVCVYTGITQVNFLVLSAERTWKQWHSSRNEHTTSAHIVVSFSTEKEPQLLR